MSMDWEAWKRLKAYANDNGSPQKPTPAPDDSWAAAEKLISDNELKRVKNAVREQKELILRKTTAELKKDVVIAEKEADAVEKGAEPIATIPLAPPAKQVSIGEEMERISNIKDPEMRNIALSEFRTGQMLASGADPNMVMIMQSKNDNRQPIQGVALQGGKQESGADEMMKWWDFFDKVEEKAAKKYAPAQTSATPAPDDPLTAMTKQTITQGFGEFLKKRFNPEPTTVAKIEDPAMISGTVGADGMFNVQKDGVAVKLTPQQFIEYQKGASDIRVAEMKATAEIGKSSGWRDMTQKLIGPIGDAIADVARGAGEGGSGIKIESTREIAGKNIVRGVCPDCAKVGVKTPIIVQDPVEGEKYECSKGKELHPKVPYVIWSLKERPHEVGK